MRALLCIALSLRSLFNLDASSHFRFKRRVFRYHNSTPNLNALQAIKEAAMMRALPHCPFLSELLDEVKVDSQRQGLITELYPVSVHNVIVGFRDDPVAAQEVSVNGSAVRKLTLYRTLETSHWLFFVDLLPCMRQATSSAT